MSFAVRGLGAEYPWWFKPVRYITHVIMFGTIGAGACALIQRAISLWCLVVSVPIILLVDCNH